MVNVNYLLALFLLQIHDSIHAPLRRDNTMTMHSDGEDNMMAIQSMLSTCQQTLTYEEIIELLAHNPCASSMEYVNESAPLRSKRSSGDDDPTAVSTNNVYALQSTINDHRTIIDDHRKMIHYLINNTVNITQLNQHYSNQHASTTPIWKSWRDVSLVLLVIICFGSTVCFLVKRLRLLDLLTALLLRRSHNHQQQLQGKTIRKKDVTVIHRSPPQRTEIPASIIGPMSISNITRDYIRHECDSNSSI